MRRAQSDQRGPETIDRLLAAGPPLELSDWALERAGLELVAGLIAGGRREVIECGSGVSTVVIARALRELGSGRLHSLEHDPGWAAAVRERLAAESLDGLARVIEAPLRPHPLAQPPCEFYDVAALAELPAAGVELLLIDGPPAGRSEIERSRYPALPLLADRLAPAAVVVLDDALRPGESWIIERWKSELSVTFERRVSGRVAVAEFSRPPLYVPRSGVEARRKTTWRERFE